jgi:hypothetical protein
VIVKTFAISIMHFFCQLVETKHTEEQMVWWNWSVVLTVFLLTNCRSPVSWPGSSQSPASLSSTAWRSLVMSRLALASYSRWTSSQCSPFIYPVSGERMQNCLLYMSVPSVCTPLCYWLVPPDLTSTHYQCHLQGNVTIAAKSGIKLEIPDGAVLENKVGIHIPNYQSETCGSSALYAVTHVLLFSPGHQRPGGPLSDACSPSRKPSSSSSLS